MTHQDNLREAFSKVVVERKEMLALADKIDTFVRYGTSTILDLDDAKKVAFTLLLSARAEPGYVVKPLEWRHYPDAFPPMWIAKAAFGSYSIEEAAGSDSPTYDVFNPTMIRLANVDGLPEAKAAAQADFEQRIRSAITATPVEPGYVDGFEACAAKVPELKTRWDRAADNDENPTVMMVARAIAENAMGRSWDDFLPLNAQDIDQSDLVDFAKAAIATGASELKPWRVELDEVIGHLGSAITQSVASDDQIIMDHVKAAHEIAKIIRRKV